MTKKKIIIVDDDPGIRDVFPLVLKSELYDLTLMANGQDIFNHQYEDPDLFILDKQLSGINGLELCRFLKAKDKSRDIPVIILSASPSLGKLAEEAGADGWLAKPFKMKDIRAITEKLLNR